MDGLYDLVRTLNEYFRHKEGVIVLVDGLNKGILSCLREYMRNQNYNIVNIAK